MLFPEAGNVNPGHVFMGKDHVALSLLLTFPSEPPAGTRRQLVPSEEINLCPPPVGLLLWAGEQTHAERSTLPAGELERPKGNTT